MYQVFEIFTTQLQDRHNQRIPFQQHSENTLNLIHLHFAKVA